MIAKIFILLGICCQLHAATWLEILEEARERRMKENPESTNIDLHSPTLEDVRKALTEGAPASLPQKYNHTNLNLMSISYAYRKKAETLAKELKWEEFIDTLRDFKAFEGRVRVSEPTMSELLVCSSWRMVAINNLPQLRQSSDLKLRKDVFLKIRKLLLQTPLNREDFLVCEKGESAYLNSICGNLPDYLKHISEEYNSDWILESIVPEPLKNEADLQKLLSLPYDRERSLKDFSIVHKAFFEWIRSKQTVDEYWKKNPKPEIKAFSFYEEHPNGLYELLSAKAEVISFPSLIMRRTRRSSAESTLLEWLHLESLDLPSDSLISNAKKKNITINRTERTISYRGSPSDEAPIELKVPDLFPN